MVERYVVRILLLVVTSGLFVNNGECENKKENFKDSVEEICNTDVFTASCAQDQVIIIETAEYGRLKLGRCVTEDFGHLSCVDDVLFEVASSCSGRHACEVRVDDKVFRRAKPCHKDLKNHLWVSYHCTNVLVPREPCRFGREAVLNAQSGLISSQVTEETGCGVTELPWIIEVGHGQRINITLFDFSMDAFLAASSTLSVSGGLGSNEGGSNFGASDSGVRKTCRVYATIRETLSPGRSSTVCGAQGRVINVFTSVSNRVELRILSNKPLNKVEAGQSVNKPDSGPSSPQFLFSYEALGCADPAKSEGTRISRVADIVSIGCEGGDFLWQMTCVNNRWIGTYENCTQGVPVNGFSQTGEVLLPYASSIVIIVVIAIAVVCFILFTGIICIQWRLRKESTAYPRSEIGGAVDYDYNISGTNPRSEKLKVRSTQAVITSGLHGGPPTARFQIPFSPGDPGNANEYATMRLLQMTVCSDGRSDVRTAGYSGSYRDSYAAIDHIYESPESIRRDDPLRQYTPAHIVLPGTAGGHGSGSQGVAARPYVTSLGPETRASGMGVTPRGEEWCGPICRDAVMGEQREVMNSYETPSWSHDQTQSWNQDHINTNLAGNYSL